MEFFDSTPIVPFTLLLAVILVVPPLFERLRLPGLVGLLFAGVLLGPHVTGLLDAEAETMQLLSEVGKIYLMFVAGLEIDLADFRKKKDRALAFGIATFALPLLAGTGVGLGFGLGLNAAILVGSLLASHTLLGYPIANRLGIASNEAVVVTVGATIFTDIAALLVLAICIALDAGEFSAASLALQLGSLAAYAALILFGIDWAGRAFFRRSGNNDSNQFLFVFLAVLLASVGAQLIDVDKIVGAFLAGLAVNDVVEHSPVEEKIEFVGSTLFIPFFFVDIGLILDLPAFGRTLVTELPLTLAIVMALLASKFLAAWSAKLLYRYSWSETLVMWSLSLPQVAATLAAALAGVNAGLLPPEFFNAAIVMMLATAVLGPVLTDRTARQLLPGSGVAPARPSETPEPSSKPFTVLVAVANPATERSLLKLAALLARREGGSTIALTIARATAHMDEPSLERALQVGRERLQDAIAIGREFTAEIEPILRIDDDTAAGIVRVARERDVQLAIVGWSSSQGLSARLLGTRADRILWSTHCPVAIVRFLQEPAETQRILVPVRDLSPATLHVVRFARQLAESNEARILLLHVADRRTSKADLERFRTHLEAKLAQTPSKASFTFHALRHTDVARAIARAARHCDLVVLRSTQRRTAGGLTVSDVTSQVLPALNCSWILLGQPARHARQRS